MELQQVLWLWGHYIPFGKLTIIQGDPGEGKTTLALRLAAACSTGTPLPGMEPMAPFNVIYQSAEDGMGDTIKPRLMEAGADLDRVLSIVEDSKQLSLLDERIEKAIVENNARLLILDPIQGYLGSHVDINRANEVRSLLKSLAAVAERTGCAIVLIGHLNKASGSSSAYGNGNILGYDRIGDTYVINPEQAETVRMIYDMYLYEGLGTGKIAQRLTELGRLNASGLNKWSHGVISRILNNQTYMGIMAYGKSFSNNYLEQKRVNNFDKSSYLCVKGDFPSIVTEEEWHRVQAIKESRMKHSFKADAKVPVHGSKENHDLWGSKMQCSCGCSFRKNRWHKNENAPWSYGYQCYNILNNGSGKKRREAGADDTGYCDQPMIADWKLELMGQKILEQVFGEQRELIQYTIDLIRQCYRSQKPAETSLTNITARMERIKRKKETLLDMRTDGEITKEEFLQQRQKLDAELQSLTAEYETLSHPNVTALDQPEWGRIQDTLEEILDLSQPKPSPDLIRKFVTKIVPDGKTNFRWYMNLDGSNTTIQDMTVEGRKDKAVVTLCRAEDEDAPGSRRVIHLQTIRTQAFIPSPLVMPHRLPSRVNG